MKLVSWWKNIYCFVHNKPLNLTFNLHEKSYSFEYYRRFSSPRFSYWSLYYFNCSVFNTNYLNCAEEEEKKNKTSTGQFTWFIYVEWRCEGFIFQTKSFITFDGRKEKWTHREKDRKLSFEFDDSRRWSSIHIHQSVKVRSPTLFNFSLRFIILEHVKHLKPQLKEKSLCTKKSVRFCLILS